MNIQRIEKGKRLSQAIVAGDTVYLAGQVARDPVPSVGDQTRQVLQQIDRYLAEAGSNKSAILSATIWLRDIGGFDEMNREWDAWMDPANPPARATVEARLADPKCLVEVMIVAQRLAKSPQST